MARLKKNKDEEIVKDDELVEEVEEDTEEETVDNFTELPDKVGTIKVVTTIDHSCVVGDERYHFKKGVPTNVPRHIKEILKNAGILGVM